MKSQISQDEKDKILTSFNKSTGSISWRNNLVHARTLKFNTGDDVLDMKNYLRYINRKQRKIIKTKNKAKVILEKYGFSEKDYGRILMSSTKSGFKGDEISKIKQYLQYKKRNEEIIKNNVIKHKNFCKLYNLIYCNEQSFSYIINNACKNLNLTFKNIDEAICSQDITNYFSDINSSNNKIQKNEIIKKILSENNINLTPGGALMTAKRDFNLNYSDDIKIINEFVILYNEKLQESFNFKKKKDQFMLDHGLLPENWRNNLVNARTYGFKSNDPFNDLTEFFKYLDECKLLLKNDLFYKSKTKEWINSNYDKLKYTISNIIDKNNIFKENYNICGIYCWKIDNIPYYIGQSTEIYNRSLDHIFIINTFPEWWLNIIDNLDLHQLELNILIKCDKKDLNYYEKYFINQLKPLSQYIENKTYKYDSIIPLKLRDFNLNNLKEKYYKIGGNINDIK